MSPVQQEYFQIGPNTAIYMGLANIKSLKASALGLKPHLWGLRKQRYIFFSLSSNSAFGKCPCDHSVTHFSHLSTDFPSHLNPFSHQANSNIQWFWPHDPQNSSAFINYLILLIKINHILKILKQSSKCLSCLFLPGHGAWISVTKCETPRLFHGIYIYPLSFLFVSPPLGFFFTN